MQKILHGVDVQRFGAGERGVVGKITGERLVDLGDARVDGRDARALLLLGLRVALFGRLRHRGDQRLVVRLPLAGQILPLARQRRQRTAALGLPRRHLGE